MGGLIGKDVLLVESMKRMGTAGSRLLGSLYKESLGYSR